MVPQIPHGTASSYSYHRCRCGICVEYKKAVDRSHYERNRERIKARVMARYAANRDEINAKDRARKASRSELEREADRAKRKAYLAQPEARAKHYVRTKRYSQTEAGRAIHVAAAHRRRGVPLDREYAAILRRDPCCYCGGPAGEIDHIVPVIRGGSGEWDNLTAACRSCNATKHDTDLLGYLLQRAA